MTQETNIQLSLGGVTTPRPLHRGVISIDQRAVPQFAFLEINDTTVQGDLRRDGAFDVVHRLLLLPESYTIVAIFFDVIIGCWKILVESDAIPVGEWGAVSLPELELLYAVVYDKETNIKVPYLSTIQAHYKCRALSIGEMLDPKFVRGWNSGEYYKVQLETGEEQ